MRPPPRKKKLRDAWRFWSDIPLHSFSAAALPFSRRLSAGWRPGDGNTVISLDDIKEDV